MTRSSRLSESHTFGGALLPAVALSLGMLSLFVTLILAAYYHHANLWLISMMGSVMPAFYFYALGTSFTGGMLIPCAVIYYYHNANRVVVDRDGEVQNMASLVTACVAAGALALQGIFPMREGDSPHTVFATIFFAFAFFHALSTSQLYLNSRSTRLRKHLPITPADNFWIRWKCYCTFACFLFTMITVVIMAYEWLTNPLMLDLLRMQKPGPLLMVGALMEYGVVVSLLLYFASYFHDLKHVRVLVFTPSSSTANSITSTTNITRTTAPQQ